MQVKLFQNKVVKNASWIMAGKIMQMLLSFIIGLLTARYLGPDNYGLINYAAAYVSFFASLCNLGINSIIVKNFVDHPEEEGKTIGTAIVLRIGSSFLSALMIIGIVSVIDRGETLTIVVVALSSISVIFQVLDTLNYWFQTRLMSKYSAIAATVAYIAVSAYKVLLLILQKDVRWFAVANTIDYIVIGLFLLYVYRKKGGPTFSFSLDKGRELLQKSSSFILAGMMVSIYACTDRFMLKQMLDEASVGYYSLAVSISNMWVFILSAIIDSMYPVIMELHSRDYDAYNKKNKQLYAIVFYTALTASAGISVLANLIVKILYGEAFLPAVLPLRIVVWYTAFSYLGVARNAWIVSENKQRKLKYIYIFSAAINVILNLILIPFWGAAGAAIASLVTQISTVVLIPYWIQELRPNVRMMIDAVRLKDI